MLEADPNDRHVSWSLNIAYLDGGADTVMSTTINQCAVLEI